MVKFYGTSIETRYECRVVTTSLLTGLGRRHQAHYRHRRPSRLQQNNPSHLTAYSPPTCPPSAISTFPSYPAMPDVYAPFHDPRSTRPVLPHEILHSTYVRLYRKRNHRPPHRSIHPTVQPREGHQKSIPSSSTHRSRTIPSPTTHAPSVSPPRSLLSSPLLHTLYPPTPSALQLPLLLNRIATRASTDTKPDELRFTSPDVNDEGSGVSARPRIFAWGVVADESAEASYVISPRSLLGPLHSRP